MFTLSSAQLREKGLEPARTRKYFLRWRNKFRNGDFGIGGDFKYVDADGTAEVRIVDVPSLPRRAHVTAGDAGEAQEVATSQQGQYASTMHTPGLTKLIVNVPRGATTYVLEEGMKTSDLKKPKGLRLMDGHVIAGRYVEPLKGSQGLAATIKATEGMWEDRRGHKVFGGERRRAETLHKMRVAENKNAKR
jgi:hypothetical protein